MTDIPKDRNGVEMYEKVLGQPEPADRPLTGIREPSINHLFAKVWTREGLSIRDRRLITIALLAAQGRRDQLRSHLRGARIGGERPGGATRRARGRRHRDAPGDGLCMERVFRCARRHDVPGRQGRGGNPLPRVGRRRVRLLQCNAERPRQLPRVVLPAVAPLNRRALGDAGSEAIRPVASPPDFAPVRR